jgi:hypothetical protein
MGKIIEWLKENLIEHSITIWRCPDERVEKIDLDRKKLLIETKEGRKIEIRLHCSRDKEVRKRLLIFLKEDLPLLQEALPEVIAAVEGKGIVIQKGRYVYPLGMLPLSEKERRELEERPFG